MKLTNLFRMATLALLTLLVGCTTKEEKVTSIYRLEGIEPAVYYAATKPLTEGDKGETVVVLIQGWHGGVQVLKEQLALQESLGDDVYVVSPMYPRTEMTQAYNIEPDGRAIWNESWPLDLTIPGVPDDDWRGGGDANGTELSSFDIIDSLFARLSDKTLYPNVKRIALVGYSAGGQFVGRYVAVGKGEVGEGIELKYVAMAPSTFLRLEPNDTWHYGLKNRPRYCREMSEEQILENLRSRRCLHACGALDTLEKSLDKTATAMKQGHNRYVRFKNFCKVVEADERWREVVTFHTIDSISHQAIKAYADPTVVNYILGE